MKRSLLALKSEVVITSTILSMPIINVFFAKEIGMSLAEVGLSQAIFSAAVLLLNVPTGWVADRFSRKMCNFAGDLIVAAAFAWYAFAQTFLDVVSTEILIGIGCAFSGGADVGLLRAYCKELNEDYTKTVAHLQAQKLIAQVLAMAIGGVIGAYSPRLAIGLSSIPYILGALLSLTLKEAGKRRVNDAHPIKDMIGIAKHALHSHKRLKWSILTYATGNESTHSLVWLLTPILIIAKVPAVIIGSAWAINVLAAWLGAWLAKKHSTKIKEWQRIAIGLSIFTMASVPLIIDINLITVSFYAGFGFVRGWYGSTLMPIVQTHADNDVQSTVVSIASSIALIFNIPLVWLMGVVSDFHPRIGFLTIFLVFAPLLMLMTIKIRQFESR